jgi:serine/threonine-protein kinase PknG
MESPPPAPTSTPRPNTSDVVTDGSTGTTAHHRLGRGIVRVPTVAVADPTRAVMSNPEVPERRRYCAKCDAPVGRSRDAEPGRMQGFCPKCGTPFSFAPKLGPGELVAGQYEVIGCLAHGGMGWVYLARDQKVGFFVALKGLLDPHDEVARSAAIAERQLLAEVEHPNIVKIHNYVEHAGDDYIVMEFVNGVSLQAMIDDRRQRNGGVADPLPVAEAIVYCLEVLPALGHLHELGLAISSPTT